MFVRWKSRQTKHAGSWAEYSRNQGKPAPKLLSAVLVESRRVDGKPRQRVVAYLGSVRDDAPTGDDGAWRRRAFWRSVDGKLDGLGLEAGQRDAIEAKLAAVVARPSAADAEGAARQLRELEAVIAQGRHGR